jgi:hypothetical protein
LLTAQLAGHVCDPEAAVEHIMTDFGEFEIYAGVVPGRGATLELEGTQSIDCVANAVARLLRVSPKPGPVATPGVLPTATPKAGDLRPAPGAVTRVQ